MYIDAPLELLNDVFKQAGGLNHYPVFRPCFGLDASLSQEQARIEQSLLQLE
jgi:hypothetical protein